MLGAPRSGATSIKKKKSPLPNLGKGGSDKESPVASPTWMGDGQTTDRVDKTPSKGRLGWGMGDRKEPTAQNPRRESHEPGASLKTRGPEAPAASPPKAIPFGPPGGPNGIKKKKEPPSL